MCIPPFRPELVDRSVYDLIAPVQQADAAEILANENDYKYELDCVRKDGTKFPIDLQGRKTIYEGKPVRVTACLDIITRKQNEERLISSEALFRSLAENIQDVIWISSSDDQDIHYISPSCFRALEPHY